MHNSALLPRPGVASVSAVLLAGVTVTTLTLDRERRVDSESMLDVSVSIRTISHVRVDHVGDSVWEAGSGSGLLVDAEGCEVWTNHHVIADAAVIEVFPRGWTRTAGIPAEVVNSTPRTDIALLRMRDCAGIPEARIGYSASVRPGDDSYAVGNPLGNNPDSISRGIISHTARYVNGAVPYLQTDAPINRGNSGGALFNRAGEVIGINTGIAATRGGGSIGIGYAVPIDLVREEIERLRNGPPSWGSAGLDRMLSSLTPEEAEVFGVPAGHGALVVTEDPVDGPSAGLLRKHDVIYRVDDAPVVDRAQVERMIGSHLPGHRLELTVMRAGASLDVAVDLGEGWQSGETQGAEEFRGHLGMALEMWDAHEDERGRFTTPVITRVASLGPAHRAHIASSQKTMMVRGVVAVPFLLDVKTVTGVVVDGLYRPVADVETLEQAAADAFRRARPMLLEIAYYARGREGGPRAELQLVGTAYYRVQPQPSAAAAVPEELPPPLRSASRGTAAALQAMGGGRGWGEARL